MTHYDAPYLDEAEHSILDHAGVPGVQSGGSESPIAVPFTIEEQANVWTGAGTIGVVTLADDDVLIAVKVAGDDFPRLYITANSIQFGDGVLDPYNEGSAGISMINGNLALGTGPGVGSLISTGGHDIDVEHAGVILQSPDNTRYRITVGNGGALSAVEVV